MGNNASQSGNIAQRQQVEPEQQWAHSFPRTPQRLNQHKVLPDVSADILVQQKLKPTNNGDILYSGGTISGRHQSTSSLSGDNIQNVWFISIAFLNFTLYVILLKFLF